MIAILTAEGYECVEAICPYNLLRRAGLDVRFIGLKEKTVKGSCGVSVECAMTARELIESGERIDMLVLPGGLPGATNLDEAPETDELIGITESCGGFFAAICAAPMVYGKRGMLKGKTATAFPEFRKYLDGAIIAEGNVARDGRFITAAGMGAAFDFGLELISALKDRETADKISAAVCAK
ncbi:MAG: DJ-1/PfpI family protein [Clostridia bacterium]|nr:DJ-1/PfpI family protein [Clostridia bacterium]